MSCNAFDLACTLCDLIASVGGISLAEGTWYSDCKSGRS